MKHKHIVTVHLPAGRKSFQSYEDQDGINLTDDVIESAPMKDNSCLLVFSTIDGMLRFRLESEIPGATVFPHHFSTIPLSPKHVAVLKEFGVEEGDKMESALMKITSHHGHFRFHPHTF